MGEGKQMTKIVRPLRSGQVTLPAEFRKQLGITEHSVLQLSLVEGELRLRPLRVQERPGSAWLEELYRRFAPVREEANQSSEGEIDAAIDAAVVAVRKRRA
jgi:bifunctional DNA-binding transcriptional regulator/antitoxin component of YhaV-PrlF toxin-antitoxin module